MSQTAMAKLPDYRARLAESRRQHLAVADDDSDLIDEDPRPEKRGGLTSAHRRAARETLAQVIRRCAPHEELCSIVLAIARDAQVDPTVRIAAVKTLWSYGVGRPAQLHQVEATVAASRVDEAAEAGLQYLDDEQLVALVDLRDRIRSATVARK